MGLQEFTGDIIKPGDSAYVQAAQSMYAKGHPELILYPRSAADVALAIAYGTTNGMTISIRSGGHSIAGFSTNDGGLVINLRYLNTVQVLDKTKGLVRIGGGATWGEVAKALQPHGLAVSSGDTASVGVGGLATGAGIGWAVRECGLTIDNIVAAEVVTADGTVHHTSAKDTPDLFWAIRGGGGNFGVVTYIDVMAHPAHDVFFGPITYSLDNLSTVLKGWRDYMRRAPEKLTTMFNIMGAAYGGMQPSAIILCCYNGSDQAEAVAALEPLQTLGTPLSVDVIKKPYAEILGEVHPPEGIKQVVHSAFVRELNDDLIGVLAAQKGQIFQIRSLGGAMSRVPATATAFAHRDSEALIVAPVFVPQTATKNDIQQVLAPWHQIEPYSDGPYINFITDPTEEYSQKAYPPATRERLVRIKREFDPRNIFNQNLNIKPLQ